MKLVTLILLSCQAKPKSNHTQNGLKCKQKGNEKDAHLLAFGGKNHWLQCNELKKFERHQHHGEKTNNGH